MTVEHLSPREEWLAELQTRNLLRYYQPRSSERYESYAIAGRSRWVCPMLATEAAVFGEAFGNTRDDLEREYGPYQKASLFLTVVDVWNTRPAGVLRVIQHSAVGLKTLNDIRSHLGLTTERVCDEHDIADLDTVWDVGTLAVRKGHRGDGMVATMLYGLLHQQMLANGIEHMVTVLDEHAHALLLQLGAPLRPICASSPFSYLGSPKSIACYMRVADAGPSIERRLGDCWLARMLARSEGLLEPIAVP